jgi:hypothetical protein
MSLIGDLRLDIADETANANPSGLVGSPDGLLTDFRVDIGDDNAATPSGGNVEMPATSTDNAIVRWDGATGEVIQNSSATLDDNGNIVTPGGISLGGYFKRGVRIVTVAGAITGLSTDNVIMVNKTVGAPTALALPASPTLGCEIIVKDAKGDAFTNNITISPAVGTIDGLASFILTQNYQSFTFIYNGTEWNVI